MIVLSPLLRRGPPTASSRHVRRLPADLSPETVGKLTDTVRMGTFLELIDVLPWRPQGPLVLSTAPMGCGSARHEPR